MSHGRLRCCSPFFETLYNIGRWRPEQPAVGEIRRSLWVWCVVKNLILAVALIFTPLVTKAQIMRDGALDARIQQFEDRVALTSNPDPHSADSAVYRAVLDSVSVSQGGTQLGQLVVIASTFTVQSPDLELDKMPGVDSAAVSDFDKRNSESHSLRYLSLPDLSLPIVLVSRHVLQSFLHNGPEPYWREFYRRYPGSSGSISFSSIGYSADGKLALLVLDEACGSLCDTVSNVVVKREHGHWRVVVIRIKEMS